MSLQVEELAITNLSISTIHNLITRKVRERRESLLITEHVNI